MPLTTVQLGMQGTPQFYGFKNRIINGGMVIDQRNAGASVTLTAVTNTFSADRWFVENATDGTATIQQVTDAPTGFSNSIRYTVTAADSSLSVAQVAYMQQRIEGFNFADLLYGTANAKTVTISFWVKSSVTGTFAVTLANSAYDRGYPASFTVSAANTWEQKSVTIAGDTTGTWIGSTNGIGVRVTFGMGAGSDRVSASGAWAAAVVLGATGQTNLMATNGATFQVAGVQLEVGVTATSFDYRPYGTELALCQRYYERSYDYGTPTGTTNTQTASWTSVGSNAYGRIQLNFKVTKRAPPTFTTYADSDGTAGNMNVWNGGTVVRAASSNTQVGTNNATPEFDNSTTWSVRSYMYANWTASAEL